MVFCGPPAETGDLQNTARSARSSVGMQFTTLCVERGRGASRPACPRGAWARWCSAGHLRKRGISRTPLVPHAPAWECSSRRSASKEDAERPDRHAHAEHGHDGVLRATCGNGASPEHRSFRTLQRGNAVHDALRRKRTRSVQTGMPTRSMGTMVFCGPPAETVDLQNTARSARSSVGMQFKTLCVERGCGASRPACPRGAWARWCFAGHLRKRWISRTPLVPHAPAWECSSRRSASKEGAERPRPACSRWNMGTMTFSGRLRA